MTIISILRRFPHIALALAALGPLSSCASSVILSPEHCLSRARWAAAWPVEKTSRYFKFERTVWAVGHARTVYLADLLAEEGLSCGQIEKLAVRLAFRPVDAFFSLLGLSRQTVELSGIWHNEDVMEESAAGQLP
jgi:hypothetical protein